MDKLEFTWDQYFHYIDLLITQIKVSCWKPDTVLVVARGGSIPGDILSRAFHCDLAIIRASSYQSNSDGSDVQHSANIALSDIAMLHNLHGNVLIVDDLCDSGLTLKYLSEFLNSPDCCFDCSEITSVKTATLLHRDHEVNIHIPNYVVSSISDDQWKWVVFPYEKYEE